MLLLSLSHVQLFATHELQHARVPVPHYLVEFAQVHVHRVSDSIQTSHPLSPPACPSHALSLFQLQCLFRGVSSSFQVAKVLEFQLQGMLDLSSQ